MAEPDLHARWWAAGEIKPVARHRCTLDMGNFGSQPCEVTEADDQRLLAYRFAEGSLDTTITWTLRPEGKGTRLVLTHADVDLDSPDGPAGVRRHGQGLAPRPEPSRIRPG
ncbi:SRPBCC domain-containing protein [Streptomyces sp. NPDC102441]|uniref:SRPBCC family protein n=1 Tax=Streptomyces sp. NPDC102441 TaxID=3366176 RepID=UPI00381BDB26